MIPCLLELKELNNTEAEKRKKVKEIRSQCFKVTVRNFLFLFFFMILCVKWNHWKPAIRLITQIIPLASSRVRNSLDCYGISSMPFCLASFL